MLEKIDSVKAIKGIGEKTAALFAKLGIHNVGDLLYHFPFRYESYAYPTPISSCVEGELVSIEGVIISSPRFYSSGKYKITEVIVKDDTEAITLKWYNSPYLRNVLKFGERLIFRGKVQTKGHNRFIVHPEIYSKEKYIVLLKSLRPVYPSTEGLTQNAIAGAIGKALEETPITDFVPAEVRKKYGLLSEREALNTIHFPKNEEVLTKGLSRLVFDEFFVFLLNMRRLKSKTEIIKNTNVITVSDKLSRLKANLGYELTDDQNRAVDEILADMGSEKTMQRLLQGDVGSGKTAVALLSMGAVAFSEKQACIMAPTEVLARQHYDYFSKIFSLFNIKTVLFCGSQTKTEKKAGLKLIENGEALIIVGTHAAIQEGVSFKNLALAVVDEQHRFGVKQREAITLKGDNPHLLLMTATPIPRTYALMLYGNMDISVLAHMPANRKPIKNCIADSSMRDAIDRFLLKEIQKGHQAYIICPLIEESEKQTAASVNTYCFELRERFGNKVRIESLHGKIKATEKNSIMDSFVKGEIDILISTTVIEVGINVPNATVMLIENAECFGLAQLHQIRGRVGRGSEQSYCIFMAGRNSESIKQRLNIVGNSNDGFYIASQDMKLRGPGDFFGVRQSGDQQFVLADPLRDGVILSMASEAVSSLDEKELEKLLEKRNSLVSSSEHMIY
ncbi:MAG: ATP-dependent DNA helicase RecG [Lachnospiraceae bacterium]